MAFAPADTPDHAALAVKTAPKSNAVRKLNEEHKAKGLPEINAWATRDRTSAAATP